MLVAIGVLLFKIGTKATSSEEVVAQRTKQPISASSENSKTTDMAPPRLRNPVSADETISMIDANNPSYSVSLALLQGRFLRLLESQEETKSLSPEQLAFLSHKLSVLRLSQTMFEATVAKVSSVRRDVAISIPAYTQQGNLLKSQVYDQLLVNIRDVYTRNRIATMFGFFGESPQVIQISSQTADGEEKYVFLHEYIDLNGTGPMTVRSTLAAHQLGPYTAFAGWLPKS